MVVEGYYTKRVSRFYFYVKILREHELELHRLGTKEDRGKKKLAFKFEISKGKSPKKDEDYEDET